MGPRQIGKTTVVKQAMQKLKDEIPCLQFSADNVPVNHSLWISDCWATARAKMKIRIHK
jgi:predicted AAA+ superfamily ATPase